MNVQVHPRFGNDFPADMDDSGEKHDSQVLSSFLEHCDEVVLTPFLNADGDAEKFQRRYKWCAVIAAVSATLAVFLAVVQLAGVQLADIQLAGISLRNVKPAWLTRGLVAFLEFVVVLITFVSVFVQQKWKDRWLLERFKAENLRLLKFRSLLEPGVWDPKEMDAEKAKRALSVEVKKITATAELEKWLSEGTPPRVRESFAHDSLTVEQRELVDYYYRKRLTFQMDYLAGAVQKYVRKNDRSRYVGPALVFGSIAVVLVHAIVHESLPEPASITLVVIAALLPVFAAGVRTYRASTEAARNAGRCKTAHYNLCELSKRLQGATDANAHLRELGFCEQVLEADVREWMRIMYEVEWCG